MPDNIFITVFTPAYNRAALLINLYNSLLLQNYDHFEWIIVDDGSKDDTREIVQGFISEQKIRISYFKQDNAGKHIAINKGVALAGGEFFFIVDSDDYLLPEALSSVNDAWHSVPEASKENCAGISGLRVHTDGTVIGGDVNYSVLDADTITYRFKLNVPGDKAEAYRTQVLRMYPFPEFRDERFCPEALVWNRIALTHFLRHINKPLYVCEYLNEGLTSQIAKVRVNSPGASLLYYSELANNRNISLKEKIKAVINFWRFSFYEHKTSFRQKLTQIGHIWAILFYPLALPFFFKERKLKN
jgi:glycosyltransferase involved in cell wall biosynthesis